MWQLFQFLQMISRTIASRMSFHYHLFIKTRIKQTKWSLTKQNKKEFHHFENERSCLYKRKQFQQKQKLSVCEFFPLVHSPSEQFILDYANDIGIVRGYVQLYVISMKIESNVNLSSLGDSQDEKQKTDRGQEQFTCYLFIYQWLSIIRFKQIFIKWKYLLLQQCTL